MPILSIHRYSIEEILKYKFHILMRIFIRSDIYYVTYVNNDVGYATCTKYSVINSGLCLIYRYYIGLSNKLSTARGTKIHDLWQTKVPTAL